MSYKQARCSFSNITSTGDILHDLAKPKNVKRGTSVKFQIYMKLLINHLQIISIINYFQLNWPYDVSIFLNNFSGVSMASGVVSLSCILFYYDIDIQSIYVETLILLMIPIFVYLIAFTIFIFSYLKTKKSQTVRFVSMTIALNILLQPSMIRKLTENVACQQIDDTCYLLSDMEINYFSDFHQKWVFLFFFILPVK